jgi:hypothetical protein
VRHRQRIQTLRATLARNAKEPSSTGPGRAPR